MNHCQALIFAVWISQFSILCLQAKDIPSDAVQVQPWPKDSGVAFVEGTVLYVRLPEKVNSPFSIPRLANSIGKVRWANQPESELVLRPHIDDWEIRLKNIPQKTSSQIIRIELDAPLRRTDKMTTSADSSGIIVLPAKFASTTGEKLRFEPQPHKNTVGYWTAQKDFATWTLNVPKTGDYHVHILQGCGKGQGGSIVRIQVDDSMVDFTVEDTGHFQNFKRRSLGQLHLKAGSRTLTLKAIKKAKQAVMDCREIRLTPAHPQPAGAKPK